MDWWAAFTKHQKLLNYSNSQRNPKFNEKATPPPQKKHNNIPFFKKITQILNEQ